MGITEVQAGEMAVVIQARNRHTDLPTVRFWVDQVCSELAAREAHGKPAFLVRLEQEHAELSERHERLGQYLHSLGFDLQEHAQKQLLLKQHSLQGELLAVLTDRLRLVHRKLNKEKER